MNGMQASAPSRKDREPCDNCDTGLLTYFPCGCNVNNGATYHPRPNECCAYTPGYLHPVPCPKCGLWADWTQFV